MPTASDKHRVALGVLNVVDKATPQASVQWRQPATISKNVRSRFCDYKHGI